MIVEELEKQATRAEDQADTAGRTRALLQEVGADIRWGVIALRRALVSLNQLRNTDKHDR